MSRAGTLGVRRTGSGPNSPASVSATGQGGADGHVLPAEPFERTGPEGTDGTDATDGTVERGGDGPPAGSGTSLGRGRPPGLLRRAFDLVLIVICALIVAAVVRTTLMQTFSIPTESMVPTLGVGDRVVVDKLTYQFREPRRQEIVVFETPPGTTSDFRQLVKRIVGVPGDVVTVDGQGRVEVNGALLEEPYLAPGTRTADLDRVVVPAGAYLVLGDNRTRSYDGRYFGLIRRDALIGRAVVRIWPMSRLGRT